MDIIIPIVILLVIIVGIWKLIAIPNTIKAERERLEHKLLNLNDFDPSQKFQALNGVIGLDEDNKKFAIIDSNNHYIFSFEDLIESEILQNETTVTKTSRSSQIAGAIVGGALVGGAGAVIGGLSGKQHSSKRIQRLTLKLTVNNLSNPVFYLHFFNSSTPTSGNDIAVVKATDSINHWHGMFSVILKRNLSDS
ncbi:hypothetical protein [Paenibacillus sp. Y412MC10]|uniref:hypothetical protein n=1 Tax=Geobacillus sp. (strain Y412MC10) TaxID=481743 RepID=UPI00119CB06C|nr:hypothetical protein [Paenibacillus sp. Y412MC10]